MKNVQFSKKRKSYRIFLVDDEEDLGWVMNKICQDEGHRLITATTFEEGIEKFKKAKNLDIAIIDLRLGRASGLTFVKKARAINDKVKFVMISAFWTPEAKSKARCLGVRHFLDKPINVDKLLDIINEA